MKVPMQFRRCQSRGDVVPVSSRQAQGGRDWELKLTIIAEGRKRDCLLMVSRAQWTSEKSWQAWQGLGVERSWWDGRSQSSVTECASASVESDGTRPKKAKSQKGKTLILRIDRN